MEEARKGEERRQADIYHLKQVDMDFEMDDAEAMMIMDELEDRESAEQERGQALLDEEMPRRPRPTPSKYASRLAWELMKKHVDS